LFSQHVVKEWNLLPQRSWMLRSTFENQFKNRLGSSDKVMGIKSTSK